VADDHPAIRRGLRLALEEGGFVICAECDSAVAAVSAALETRPDICLLDVRMPGNGINAAAAIAAELPEAKIVMLSVSADDDDVLAAVRAGADGYLLKSIDPARLPHALRGVLSGEAPVPRTLVARLIAESSGDQRRRTSREKDELTRRETEVLELLAEGLPTSEIARRMAVSQVTVRAYISTILRKWKLPDRRTLIEKARLRLWGPYDS
jgi:DNA-binding NarL/FixJ family response regulator